jgi:hypothetical protein
MEEFFIINTQVKNSKKKKKLVLLWVYKQSDKH